MAKNDIEKVLTVFQGVGAGDADLATKYMNAERYMQHGPRQWHRVSRLPKPRATLRKTKP